MQYEKQVIVDNVRSAHNVGSIFRTGDGAGVSRIVLCGYTPAPIDRFGRVREEIRKTSLGASDMVAWQQKETMEEVLAYMRALQGEGFSVVAVEQTPSAVSLYDFTVPKKVAYILGNEVEGVSQELLQAADICVHIPMHGQKESLNVSVAAGIVLFWEK